MSKVGKSVSDKLTQWLASSKKTNVFQILKGNFITKLAASR